MSFIPADFFAGVEVPQSQGVVFSVAAAVERQYLIAIAGKRGDRAMVVAENEFAYIPVCVNIPQSCDPPIAVLVSLWLGSKNVTSVR